MIDFDSLELNNISDESIAAYIDGNATEVEKSQIESCAPDDSMLSEIIDIANDSKFENYLFDEDMHNNIIGLDNFDTSAGFLDSGTLTDSEDFETSLDNCLGNDPMDLCEDVVLDIQNYDSMSDESSICTEDIDQNDLFSVDNTDDINDMSIL